MFIILFGFYVLFVTYKFEFCVIIKPTGAWPTIQTYSKKIENLNYYYYFYFLLKKLHNEIIVNGVVANLLNSGRCFWAVIGLAHVSQGI